MAHFNPNIMPRRAAGAEDCNIVINGTAASRAEMSTTDTAAPAGFAQALELIAGVGVAEIERHVQGLLGQLRAGLAALPGARLIAWLPPERSSGICSFAVGGWPAQAHRDLVEALYREERIVVKFQPEFAGIRVSLAGFNSPEEVERLLDALRRRLER